MCCSPSRCLYDNAAYEVPIQRIRIAEAVSPQVHRHDIYANGRLIAIYLNDITSGKVLGYSKTGETLTITLGNLSRAGSNSTIRPCNSAIIRKDGLHFFDSKILVINQLKIFGEQFGYYEFVNPQGTLSVCHNLMLLTAGKLFQFLVGTT
jgi:hypothetical protein